LAGLGLAVFDNLLKCLEKDRSRRDDTANGLARDIERYLHDEPVEACPPSTAYRFRKFARKYRLPVTVAAAFTWSSPLWRDEG
jgi:hypothetical protein